MGYGLTATADELQCSERTLRRYVDEGLLRGERRSRQEVRLPYAEERYLRQHWKLLSSLRRALRTEHSVRLAVLFGSSATGGDVPGSDVDLLIEHSTGDLGQVVELQRRLHRSLDRSIHLVQLEDAERSPSLMADVLLEGRVIVNRSDTWSGLDRNRPQVLRQATAEEETTHLAARKAIEDARERLGDR